MVTSLPPQTASSTARIAPRQSSWISASASLSARPPARCRKIRFSAARQ
jgi:hypothetical protein